jgi:hypothetical protein
MVAGAQQNQVLRLVIERVVVLVMHMFAARKRSTKFSRHDDAMLVFPNAGLSHLDLPIDPTFGRPVESPRPQRKQFWSALRGHLSEAYRLTVILPFRAAISAPLWVSERFAIGTLDAGHRFATANAWFGVEALHTGGVYPPLGKSNCLL